jgi:hypothetical protein
VDEQHAAPLDTQSLEMMEQIGCSHLLPCRSPYELTFARWFIAPNPKDWVSTTIRRVGRFQRVVVADDADRAGRRTWLAHPAPIARRL